MTMATRVDRMVGGIAVSCRVVTDAVDAANSIEWRETDGDD